MVKILANGDIVPDDDPRAAGTGRPNSTTQRHQRHQGGIEHGDPRVMRRGGGGSMFGQLNERLLQAGIPRFNIGQYAIEPIVTVGMLIAFLLLGFKGLILGAVLFFVSKWSEGQGGGDAAQSAGQTGGGGGGTGWGGQGHRLGR